MLHRGSVLPQIETSRTVGGTYVRAFQTPGGMREVLLYGFAFVSVLSVAFLPKGGVLSHVALLVQAAGFFAAFFGLLTTYLRRRRLFRATLLVRPWPIRLGATVEARFRAMVHRSAPISTLTAKLRCAEEITIGYGRDEVKRSAVAYEFELPCSKQERQIVEESWTFTIPTNLPASFVVPSNRLEWRVNATLTTKGVDVPADFLLLVIPEVAP